eukprot:TRINITY_DN19643_c0_g1::TRINITY_DN19643_c0_g1_i1::g.3247::m.3247 TRINITY_DN19643_c0_g1::TRINITY_DN19643_c0_g1_i1::g.3247  ORF type:complete len:456 (-),score=134.73,sp/P19182/IFRD1_MOUSE/27.92/3e-30,IFRD/PF05004.8/2.2e-40,IFRD_C/PF04836.7/6.3e+02,IFRD_C/PF04836.7/6.7e-06,HEAT/PF02985.17/1.1e+02,HEAT/PF02985.17/33,HEAT/PF02985.17/35 TRINITY_DN19643_c0_g1_i1:235-1401(-)
MDENVGVEHHSDYPSELREAIEKLTEKRGETRIAALNTLCSIMSQHYAAMGLENQVESLAAGLRNSLRKGTPKESALALNAFTLLIINRTEEGESLLDEHAEQFRTLIRDAKTPDVRAASTAALAMTVFLIDLDLKHTAEALQLFEELLQRKGGQDEEIMALISAWGFLATCYPKAYQAKQDYDRLMKLHHRYLQHDNVDVRMSAGENIAFLYEAKLAKLNAAKDKNHESDETPEDPLDPAIRELIHTLATDSNKHRARKERSRQRSLFRDIRDTLDGQAFEPEEIKIGTEKVMFASWAETMQLDALRGALGKGFHIHVAENYTVRDLFGLGEPRLNGGAKQHMSDVEKRMYLSRNSPAAKARTQSMKKKRDASRLADMGRFVMEEAD